MARPVSSTRDRSVHLLYGEGPTEAAFLTYLKSVFAARGDGFQVKVDGDEGGDPVHVLRKAIKHRRGAEYASKTVVIDTDRPWCPDNVIARAAADDIRLLPSRPCLEGLLLKILNQPVPGTSAECKTTFHRDYLTEAKMMDHRNFGRIFNEEMLRDCAGSIPTLAALIRFLETGTPPTTILP